MKGTIYTRRVTVTSTIPLTRRSASEAPSAGEAPSASEVPSASESPSPILFLER